MMMIASVLIMFVIYGQTTRQNELQDTLSTAVEQSLENMKFKKNYTINNTDEFIADFVQSLTLSIESDSDIEVNVLNVDTDKGLFDVEVKEKFRYPNKKKGTITCRKTIVLDEYQRDKDTYHFVKFVTQKEYKSNDFVEFKTYSVSDKSIVIFPQEEPTIKDHKFKGWSLEKPTNDNSPTLIDTSKKMIANKNIYIYAVFE